MKLNVKQYGANGPNLVILHGLLGSSQNWHTAANKLGENLQVLVPDQRNHGDSPHADHSVESLGQDVLALLDLHTIDQTFLMGHSMGGLAAMSFAFANPERLKGLIIVDIAPVAQLSEMNWIFEALGRIDLSQLKQRQQAEEQLAKSIESPLIRQFLLQNLKREDDGGYIWRCNLPELHNFVKKDNGFEPKENDRYEGPALFIGGERSDHRIEQREGLIRKHFPNYELIMIPGAGHWVHFEAMHQFIDTVDNFIDAVP